MCLKDNIIFDKIMIIDGSYAIHRSLHVENLFNLRNSKGDRTGGIFGFLKSIQYELAHKGEYFPVVCWDEGLASRRLQLDPHYKKADERELNDKVVLTPEELDNDYVTQYRKQRNKLIELLTYFGVPSLKFKGWEGDDLMYIMSRLSNRSIIMTDDKDLLQLLSPTCEVRRPMKNQDWTLDSFTKHKEYDSIYEFVIYKAIMGDGSDNIPKSCTGVGDASVNDFIRLLLKYNYDGIWDFTNYPRDIDSMKSKCEEYGVKYKKAYLNFDKDRFIINLGLVDLGLVEKDVDSRIIDSIITTISSCKSEVDYFKVIKILSDLEIKEFSADNFMGSVASRYRNLMIQR